MIKLRRQVGEPGPFTLDPTFQQYRFCNVHREDDRTTEWYRKNIRLPLDSRQTPVQLILATIGFRWFNYIPTGEVILPALLNRGWDTAWIRELLRGHKGKLITGAYMVKTPAGVDKLTGICDVMDEARQISEVTNLGHTRLEVGWNQLMKIPYMGPFMAYEVISDLRWTYLFRDAEDINTWANPGPGAARGLGWIFHDDHKHYNRHSAIDRDWMLQRMKELLDMSRDDTHWPQQWPAWEMREVEHWLCEYDKWRRGHAGQRLKRRFSHGG